MDGGGTRGGLDKPGAVAIGTTRTLTLGGGITFDEVFWAWEPSRRIGFSVTAASIGWLKGLSEVYEITPLSSERCKLRWVVAASFPEWLGRLEPGIGRVFQIIQRRHSRSLSMLPVSVRHPPSERCGSAFSMKPISTRTSA